jgi:hypothetical protein
MKRIESKIVLAVIILHIEDQAFNFGFIYNIAIPAVG